jgi:hypothetical protein
MDGSNIKICFIYLKKGQKKWFNKFMGEKTVRVFSWQLLGKSMGEFWQPKEKTIRLWWQSTFVCNQRKIKKKVKTICVKVSINEKLSRFLRMGLVLNNFEFCYFRLTQIFCLFLSVSQRKRIKISRVDLNTRFFRSVFLFTFLLRHANLAGFIKVIFFCI